MAKSASELVNTRSQAERMPGMASGSVMVMKVRSREAHRSRAASSRVESIALSTLDSVR